MCCIKYRRIDRWIRSLEKQSHINYLEVNRWKILLNNDNNNLIAITIISVLYLVVRKWFQSCLFTGIYPCNADKADSQCGHRGKPC